MTQLTGDSLFASQVVVLLVREPIDSPSPRLLLIARSADWLNRGLSRVRLTTNGDQSRLILCGDSMPIWLSLLKITSVQKKHRYCLLEHGEQSAPAVI